MDILLPNCRTCHVYSVNSLVSFKSFLCHKNEMTPSKQVSGDLHVLIDGLAQK